MNVILNDKACSLTADELVAYVRLAFNADENGYVTGSRTEMASKVGMSSLKTKRTIDALFEKGMVSIGNGKVFIWNHEKVISFDKEGIPNEHEFQDVDRVPLSMTVTKKDGNNEAQKVCDYFNELMADKAIPQIRAMTSNRKKTINARIKEYGLNQVYAVIDNTAASSFLNGAGSRGFVAKFDWIMRPNNFIKVLEGNYADRNGNAKSAERDYYTSSAELVHQLYSNRKTEGTE